jgi:transcription antitermination factor NusG
MGFRWYVAQTYPNCESAAERRLNRQLFATHLPRRTTRKAIRGQILTRQTACFPGYLFVLLAVEPSQDAWKAATYTRGVLRLLPVSERPLPVATSKVLELHMAELDGALVSGQVEPGSRLRVYRGPFVGRVIECLAAADEHGLVRALFEAMGRKVEIRVPVENVTVL